MVTSQNLDNLFCYSSICNYLDPAVKGVHLEAMGKMDETKSKLIECVKLQQDETVGEAMAGEEAGGEVAGGEAVGKEEERAEGLIILHDNRKLVEDFYMDTSYKKEQREKYNAFKDIHQERGGQASDVFEEDVNSEFSDSSDKDE